MAVRIGLGLAGFSFRFGSPGDPVVQGTARALSRFTPGLQPDRYLAVGGADEVVGRVEEYLAAGVSKFVLRPMATDGADAMRQTEQLVDQVLSRVHGAPVPAASGVT